MEYRKSMPFSSGTEYEIFKDNWCYMCIHYKEREDDGFPEFPENGGCRILDFMERARFNSMFWPNKKIVKEWDGGEQIRSHICVEFVKEQLLEKYKQFLETFKQAAKEAQDDRYTPDNICGIPRKGGEEKWKEHSMK